MSQFEKTVLYGAAFAIGGFIATIVLTEIVQLKPIAGSPVADTIRSAVGKGN